MENEQGVFCVICDSVITRPDEKKRLDEWEKLLRLAKESATVQSALDDLLIAAKLAE